jgi:hypothetical protein
MNAWGCDRCKVTYPAQSAAPVAPAASAASAAQKKKILLFAGIGAAAVALVVVLVVVLGGGGSGGKSTPKELFESAASLAAKGDVDGLVPLFAEQVFTKVVDCGSKGGAEYGGEAGQKKLVERLREDLKHQLKSWDGLTVTVSSVDEKGEADGAKAGDEKDGCKVKVDITMQKFKVKVHAKGKDGEADSEVVMRAIKIDGRWYLEELPEAPDASGDKAKMKTFKDRMCACDSDKDPSGCADKVDADFQTWSMKVADKYKDKKPDEAEMKDLAEIAKDYMDCQMKAKMAGMGSGN